MRLTRHTRFVGTTIPKFLIYVSADYWGSSLADTGVLSPQFMNESAGAARFTASLLGVIRLQRHLATRVVIATQEPTISPKLLDLCSMTFVHRFTSPKWLHELSGHLAGASSEADRTQAEKAQRMHESIVNLDIGEALLFVPSAIMSVREVGPNGGQKDQWFEKLGMRYLRIRIRKRLTEDGGRSIMAV